MGIPIHTSISPDPVPEVPPFPTGTHGAEVVFRGIVRGTEDGRPIAGIDYSAYPAMAEKRLREIAAAAAAEHPGASIFIHHVTGFVAAGGCSVVVAVAERHSAEAFELCRELLARLKREVPIWKEPRWSAPAGE